MGYRRDVKGLWDTFLYNALKCVECDRVLSQAFGKNRIGIRKPRLKLRRGCRFETLPFEGSFFFFELVLEFLFEFWDGVIPTAREWIASQNAPQCQKCRNDEMIIFIRRNRVVGTCGSILACGHSSLSTQLVSLDPFNHPFFHHRHR